MKGSIDMTYRQPTTISLPRSSHLLATRSPRYYPWVIAGVLFGHIAVFAGMTQLQPTPMLLPPPKPVQIRWVELAPPPKALPEPPAPRVPEPVKPKIVPFVPSPPVAKTPPKLVPTVAPTAKPIAKPVDRVAEPAPVAAPILVSPVPSAMPAPVVTPPVPQPQPTAPVVTPALPVADPTPRTVAIDGVAYKRPPQVQYPEQALRRGETGTVLVRALINIKGQVDTASIETSSGHRSLDQAAVRAVKRASFHAYRENGITQSVYVLIPIAFTPTEE